MRKIEVPPSLQKYKRLIHFVSENWCEGCSPFEKENWWKQSSEQAVIRYLKAECPIMTPKFLPPPEREIILKFFNINGEQTAKVSVQFIPMLNFSKLFIDLMNEGKEIKEIEIPLPCPQHIADMVRDMINFPNTGPNSDKLTKDIDNYIIFVDVLDYLGVTIE